MTLKQATSIFYHKDSAFLILGLINLWFTISLIADSNTSINNMIANKGVLTNIDSAIIKVKDKPLFKEITKELRLTLANKKAAFIYSTTINFGEITSALEIGDTVTIYTIQKVWGIFGLKNKMTIRHLSKKNQVLINYDTYKKSLNGLFLITGIAFLILIIIYFDRVTRRYSMEIKNY